MQFRMKSLVPCRSGYHFVDIFGYTTKGLPGIEVVAPRVLKRAFKDKIIYISKCFKHKIPLRRYVLCVDLGRDEDSFFSDFSQLELPLYLMYLVLSENLSITNLDHCLSWGNLNCAGEVSVEKKPMDIIWEHRGDETLLIPKDLITREVSRFIELEDILPGHRIDISGLNNRGEFDLSSVN